MRTALQPFKSVFGKRLDETAGCLEVADFRSGARLGMPTAPESVRLESVCLLG